MKPGTVVRMSDKLKQILINNGSEDHVKEFGNCLGIVEGFTNYNNKGDVFNPSKFGPEVDVRWMPSRLRYGYDPKFLLEDADHVADDIEDSIEDEK